MKTSQLTLLVLAVVIIAVTGHAAEYDVKQDGTGNFKAIQAAINASADGDVIVVHPGTYYENIEFKGKNIVLRSVAPEDEQIVASTIIDGARQGSVVTFEGTESETCLLSGFTITNGYSSTFGGGIYGMGNGVGPATHGAITNCRITGNEGSIGGGLSCCAGTISNCTISDNQSFGMGGGLDFCNGAISNCTITGNSVSWSMGGGGGLYQCGGTISNCTISCNSASAGGGLDRCEGAIIDCIITDNSATGGMNGSWGGGLEGCDGTISNCTITGNSANSAGGGVSFSGGQISNCTISGNSAGQTGGGLDDYVGAISNCVIWANEAPKGPNLFECHGAVIRYSCVPSWTGEGEGNIYDDPLFVSGPLGAYYLSCVAAGQAADSPCIDRGSATAESLGLDKFTTRTDGAPDAGIVDMGVHYPVPEAKPRIGCSLNQDEFQPGQLLVASVDAQNEGGKIVMDVYLGFILPDGSILCFTGIGFAQGLVPWLVSITLPQGIHYGPAEVFRLLIPESASPGDYLLGCALAKSGESPSAGDVSLFPFRISSK